MNIQRLLAGTLALVLVAGLGGQAFAQTSEDAPINPPSATNDINPPEVCDGSDTDLLIQDVVSWGVGQGQDSRGAFVNELILQQKNWCAIGSDAIGSTNLSQFKVIIIPSVQPISYYANVFPGNILHSDIDAWVQAGGVLSVSLATFAVDNIFVTLPQGMTMTGTNTQDHTIVDPTHPLITGVSPCPSGNCGVIVDAGSQNDIDDWNDSSHTGFDNVPAGANVILSDSSGDAVAVEYKLS